MTGFASSPRLVKAGIALLDPESGAIQRLIALQYNPDTLTRTLAPKSPGETTDRSEALRLKGPPVETIKLEAEIDAADLLETGDGTAVDSGIASHLAALETIVYPTTTQLQETDALARSGTLEIAPIIASLALFLWGKNRVVPVRLTEFTITEEAFDPELNPIRAKVSLGMRVLSTDDLGFGGKGGSLYFAYQQQKERLSTLGRAVTLNTFGIGGSL
ncbi:MAG: hypothetical protein IT303_00230 [Dehalococcoidia bacterium]|nr:hypothetical protein [Dehalococcoidia bacterium]